MSLRNKPNTTQIMVVDSTELTAQNDTISAASRSSRVVPDRSVFTARIGIAFAIIAAMTAILAGIITFVAWSIQFDAYVRNNLQDTADYVAYRTAEAYASFGSWNFSLAHLVPQVGARADVGVQIYNQNGTLIYDESLVEAYAQSDLDMAALLARGDLSSSPTDENQIMTSPVMVGHAQVGEVRVWAYGSSGLLTAHDLEMRNSSLLGLAAAGFVAIIIATFAGGIYARSLVRPILRVTETAQRLRDGDENSRTCLTGSDEIAQLGMTFDHMADAIQKDRLRERRLTEDVAHELRTPLMGIQATVEAMEDGIYPADSEHLSIVSRETRRLAGLASTILELSRLENATERFVMEALDLNIPVSASINVNAVLIESMGLRLETTQVPGLCVKGNSERLQQAIGNLLANAARYTPEGGEVRVCTYAEGTYACVSIEDTGVGISSEDIENIFGRFWRADGARSRASGGVGVGLTITKEIIDRHEGEITVESEPDVGTTFTIKLPLFNGNNKQNSKSSKSQGRSLPSAL